MSLNAMRLFIKKSKKKLPEKFLTNIQGIGYKSSKRVENSNLF